MDVMDKYAVRNCDCQSCSSKRAAYRNSLGTKTMIEFSRKASIPQDEWDKRVRKAEAALGHGLPVKLTLNPKQWVWAKNALQIQFLIGFATGVFVSLMLWSLLI